VHGRVNPGARIAWTGHRPELFLDPESARAAVDRAAEELLQQRPERFLVGGQRGVDTWAALAAHRLGVPFTLVLPLEVDEFAADWTADDRQCLQDTLGWATEVRVIGGLASSAYTERNRVLATSADLMVAVWTGRARGGTAETVTFAQAAGVPIHEVRLPPSPLAERATGRGL
jgi:hypothetical protein